MEECFDLNPRSKAERSRSKSRGDRTGARTSAADGRPPPGKGPGRGLSFVPGRDSFDGGKGAADSKGGGGGGKGKARSKSRSRSRDGGGGLSKGKGGKGKGSKGGHEEEDTSNDWSCAECGNSNFARRTDCFKCGAPQRSRSGSRDRGGGGGASRGCGSKSGGGKAGKADENEKGLGSRDLLNQMNRQRSRSASSGSSSSASAPPTRPGLGLFDSEAQTAEVKIPKVPRRKRRRLEIDIGRKVELHGLVGAAQYNGYQGKVFDGPNEKGRWEVDLEFVSEPKTLSLLPANLHPKPTRGWEVIAAGLTVETPECEVESFFKRVGQVRQVKITKDTDGVSKGVALVEMCLKEAAEKALETLNECTIRGNVIKVQWSTMVLQEMGLLKKKGEKDDEGESTEEAEGPKRSFKERQAAAKPRGGFSAAPAFKMGEEVVVAGLIGAAQYNGMTARIEGLRGDGRFEVFLMQPGGKVKSIALKAENLVAASARPSSSTHTATADAALSSAPSSVPSRVPSGAVGGAGSGAVSDAGCGAGSTGNAEDSGAGSIGKADGSGGAAGGAAGSDAGAADVERAERRRKRKSAWDDGNDGGTVYGVWGLRGDGAAPAAPAPAAPAAAASLAPAAAAAAEEVEAKPLPPEAELANLPAKELRKLLVGRGVDLKGCMEKADLLEKARAFAATDASA